MASGGGRRLRGEGSWLRPAGEDFAARGRGFGRRTKTSRRGVVASGGGRKLRGEGSWLRAADENFAARGRGFGRRAKTSRRGSWLQTAAEDFASRCVIGNGAPACFALRPVLAPNAPEPLGALTGGFRSDPLPLPFPLPLPSARPGSRTAGGGAGAGAGGGRIGSTIRTRNALRGRLVLAEACRGEADPSLVPPRPVRGGGRVEDDPQAGLNRGGRPLDGVLSRHRGGGRERWMMVELVARSRRSRVARGRRARQTDLRSSGNSGCGAIQIGPNVSGLRICRGSWSVGRFRSVLDRSVYRGSWASFACSARSTAGCDGRLPCDLLLVVCGVARRVRGGPIASAMPADRAPPQAWATGRRIA